MAAPNKPLGDFLRSRRTRPTVAIPANAATRRRTPGLKRDEVARVAGISVEWYTKLEQGRAARPSEETIAALATALQLDGMETRHLRLLAAAKDRQPFERETAPDGLATVVAGMKDPAYLTGRRWDILAWNAAAAELLFDFATCAEADRNILVFMLTDPRAKALFGDSWALEARRMVALFRAGYDAWAGDPAFDALVTRLKTESAEMAMWWAQHDLAAPVSGAKTLHHPRGGEQRYDYASFQANDAPGIKLAIYVAADRSPE